VTDEPMLRAVGHPVAVNPDRDLARLARDEDWPILRFERPVRLRDRFPDRSGTMLAAGAGVVAVGVGAWLWWHLRHRDES
jgi:hypothetical protein